MTVKDLISRLQTFPEHLIVVYPCCSEYCVLVPEAVGTMETRDNGGYQSRIYGSEDALRAKTVLVIG